MIAAALLAAGSVGVAANLQEALNTLAPETAKAVSDVNLRNLYTEAVALSLDGTPIEEALRQVAEDFSEEDIVYTVEGGDLVVRTELSCRSLARRGSAVRIVDC
jgi:hypothetical protein